MEPVTSLPQTPKEIRNEKTAEAAKELEAAFLSEFLKAADFVRPFSSMGGGAGEDQFNSLLRDEYARILASSGQLGLSDLFLDAVKDQNLE